MKTFSGLFTNKNNNSNSFLGNNISFLSLITTYSSLFILIDPKSIIFGLFFLELIFLAILEIFLSRIFGFTGFEI